LPLLDLQPLLLSNELTVVCGFARQVTRVRDDGRIVVHADALDPEAEDRDGALAIDNPLPFHALGATAVVVLFALVAVTVILWYRRLVWVLLSVPLAFATGDDLDAIGEDLLGDVVADGDDAGQAGVGVAGAALWPPTVGGGLATDQPPEAVANIISKIRVLDELQPVRGSPL
jgi:predicted anti-sigma-YlaC factor YlaD